MEERRNYYEIIAQLSFDPIETKDKKIIDAVELWKLLEDKRGISQEEVNGEQRQQELDMYDDIKKCLTNKDMRKAEADKMKKKQTKKLNDIISVLKESSEQNNLYVSNARIISIAKSLRLDKEKTVKKVFEGAGFKVIERKAVNITKDILLSDTIFNSICKNIDKLNTIKHKEYPWLNKVSNLYDLVAYYKNDEANIKLYSSKPSEELKHIAEEGAADVAGKLDTLSHCFADLYQAGCTQVFKNEKMKIKYDNSLKAKNLDSLFSLLKELPEEMKKDSYIAEICIKKIQMLFPDPDVALAIYNKEAGNILDPYEPDNGDVEFVCGSCKSLSKMKYGTEKSKCKCNVCGAPLFVKCLKCSAVIPAVADLCPECGFSLIESKFFDKYCALAQSALDSMNIDEARKQLALAKHARPDAPQLNELEKQIDKAIYIYEMYLHKIRDLMNQHMYMQAKKELSEFCSKYPSVNIDEIKKDIDKALDEASKMFEQLNKYADKCGICFDILEKVKDYNKAIEYIKDKKPLAPTDVGISISVENIQANLHWKGTGEREVTYCIIRKEGSKPISINDGTIVVNQKLINQFSDKAIEAGKIYHYAIYSHRLGTYSEAIYLEPIIILQELNIKNILRNSSNGKCVFSWELPKNCKGVKISRKDDNNSSTEFEVISEYASVGYEDKDVKNGVTYEYKLQCIYSTESGSKYSRGIMITATPDTEPEQVVLLSANVKNENAVQINWKSNVNTTNCLLNIYDIKSMINVPEGTKYFISELSKLGNKIATISDIDLKTSEVRLIMKKAYRIVAFTVKGERAISSNCLSFSNFDKLEIDKTKTKISGGNLIIQLKDNFGKDLTNIRYAVATKNSDEDKVPWCTMDDALNMTPISVAAYSSDGIIRVNKVPEKELYISIIGEYVSNNQSYFSEAAKLRISNRPKAVIKYKIVWGFLNRRNNVKLIIECNVSQELPEMLLCSNKTVKVPLKSSSPDNVILCRVAENANYVANTKIEIPIQNYVWNSITRGNEIRLFIPEDSYAEFKMAPEIETLRIP